MITRSRIFITAAVLCHLLLAPAIVTSQTLPPAAATGIRSRERSIYAPRLCRQPCQPNRKKSQLRFGRSHQEKDGAIYHLRGKAEIDYRTYILHADEITYNADTGDSEPEGHVVLDGGPYDEHVEASHGTYNIHTQVGIFYSVIGTVGFRMRASRYVLTTTNPFAFTGKIVEKHGPDHYLVRQGTVTTCQLPRPKWLFNARHISVDVDSTAKLYNSDFELMGIPVFYFPFVTHPGSERARQSGLLDSKLSATRPSRDILSATPCTGFSTAAWTRSLGAEYYSKRGWSQHGEFRARPSDSSYVFFNYAGMVDRGIGYPRAESGRRGRAFSSPSVPSEPSAASPISII